MGRQHQGMDRSGVRQVQEGSGKQGKMEKTGCKIICGAPPTLKVKELMMMMIMMMMMTACQRMDWIVYCMLENGINFLETINTIWFLNLTLSNVHMHVLI